MEPPTQRSVISRLLRLLLAVFLSLLCIGAASQAVRLGLSRMFAGYGLLTGDLGPVDQALRMTPDDPDARVNRAALLSQRGDHREAAAELERAAQLRPRDYYLWLELGMSRDRMGDAAGAELAFRESKRLAPNYAQPAWQLGNLLFRAGRQDEALAELVRAAKTDSTFVPAAIELGWAVRPSAAAIKEILKPQTAFEHLALAHFFARHGDGADAIAEWHSSGSENRDEIVSLIRQLIGQSAYRDAHELWAQAYVSGNSNPEPPGVLMYDGGFERPLAVDDPGFGWRVSQKITNVNLSIDANNPREGAKSLRIDFHGVSNAPSAVSQMVLVEPKTHYRLQFSSRVQELVSGGLPVIVVADAAAPQVEFIVSPGLAGGTDQWRDSNVEFQTSDRTQAVVVQIKRLSCASEPCPIFGSLWLDSFSMQRK
ncbi:MAG: hypothetical protein QOD75_891 [Blastocatellia bacterium]|jgi:hypothetical protein|nr:hypothetical protein [Blastocatellia bacterium]